MGLDITAYKKLRLAPEGTPEDDERNFAFWVNPNFPGRDEGLVPGSVYDGSEDEFYFPAGSYGGYNWWRNELARLAGFASANAAWGEKSGPFWELISFSDCEGVIGPVVAKKLLADFVAFEGQIASLGEVFVEKYNAWKKAFELAADGGAVRFH